MSVHVHIDEVVLSGVRSGSGAVAVDALRAELVAAVLGAPRARVDRSTSDGRARAVGVIAARRIAGTIARRQ